jgi:hypothetical protein
MIHTLRNEKGDKTMGKKLQKKQMRFIKADSLIHIFSEEHERYELECPYPMVIENKDILEDETCDDPECTMSSCSYARIRWSETEQAVVACDDFEPKVIFSGDEILGHTLH